MDFERPEELIGKRIAGRFRVEKVLGTGGMGIVLQVRNEGLGASVALKLLKQSMLPEARARFRREANIAAKLSGEHVVRVTDAGATSDGTPFMVMELVGGTTLADVLAASGPLPIDEAVLRVIEACEALAEAHAHGIVHRDLKPSNLLLAERADGRVVLKVADFGVAKIDDGEASVLTHDDSPIGSPSYMSPEQIDDPRLVDGRSDLFSLGVVLFELLSGKRPFDARSVSGTLVRVASHDPPDLVALRRQVPEALAAVVRRALAKAPGDRYQSAVELAEALAPFAGPDGQAAAERVARTAARSSVAPDASSASSSLRPREPTTMTDAGALGTRTGRSHGLRRTRWRVALVATLAVGVVVGWMFREARTPAGGAPTIERAPAARRSMAVVPPTTAPPIASASASASASGQPAPPSISTRLRPACLAR